MKACRGFYPIRFDECSSTLLGFWFGGIDGRGASISARPLEFDADKSLDASSPPRVSQNFPFLFSLSLRTECTSNSRRLDRRTERSFSLWIPPPFQRTPRTLPHYISFFSEFSRQEEYLDQIVDGGDGDRHRITPSPSSSSPLRPVRSLPCIGLLPLPSDSY